MNKTYKYVVKTYVDSMAAGHVNLDNPDDEFKLTIKSQNKDLALSAVYQWLDDNFLKDSEVIIERLA